MVVGCGGGGEANGLGDLYSTYRGWHLAVVRGGVAAEEEHVALHEREGGDFLRGSCIMVCNIIVIFIGLIGDLASSKSAQ